MMKTKRITAAVMLAAVLLASCGEAASAPSQSAAPQQETAASDAAVTASSAETDAPDNAPVPELEAADLGGFTLRIANIKAEEMSWANIQMTAEEQDATVVNDAIYARNLRIKEKHNCEITETLFPRNVNHIKKSVAAGSDEYDITMMYDLDAPSVITSMINWHDIPHVDLSAEWWNPLATSMFDIHGYQYFTAGNSSLAYISRPFTYLVNKKMYADLGMTADLFGAVSEGKWTQDMFMSLVAQAPSDLNGDGVFNEHDRYGIFGHCRIITVTAIGGAGINYAEKTEDGDFVFRMHEDKKAIDLIEKLVHFKQNNPNIYYNKSPYVHETDPADLFKNGQALFHLGGNPNTIVQLREMDDDFSILPLPKYDEAQEKYYAIAYGSALTGIPVTVPQERWEAIGTIMEDMTRMSQNDLIPQYKEVLLKTKASRDDDSSAMIDIVFGSITFDPGIVLWCGVIPDDIAANIYMKESDAVVSYLESKQPKYQKELDKFNDSLG